MICDINDPFVSMQNQLYFYHQLFQLQEYLHFLTSSLEKKYPCLAIVYLTGIATAQLEMSAIRSTDIENG